MKLDLSWVSKGFFFHAWRLNYFCNNKINSWSVPFLQAWKLANIFPNQGFADCKLGFFLKKALPKVSFVDKSTWRHLFNIAFNWKTENSGANRAQENTKEAILQKKTQTNQPTEKQLTITVPFRLPRTILAPLFVQLLVARFSSCYTACLCASCKGENKHQQENNKCQWQISKCHWQISRTWIQPPGME